jgi:hypothetical protein
MLGEGKVEQLLFLLRNVDVDANSAKTRRISSLKDSSILFRFIVLLSSCNASGRAPFLRRIARLALQNHRVLHIRAACGLLEHEGLCGRNIHRISVGTSKGVLLKIEHHSTLFGRPTTK